MPFLLPLLCLILRMETLRAPLLGAGLGLGRVGSGRGCSLHFHSAGQLLAAPPCGAGMDSLPTIGVPGASHQPHVGLAGEDHTEHPCAEWVCKGLKPPCCFPAPCRLALAGLSPSLRDILQPGSGRDCQAAAEAGRVWLGQVALLTPSPAPRGGSQAQAPSLGMGLHRTELCSHIKAVTIHSFCLFFPARVHRSAHTPKSWCCPGPRPGPGPRSGCREKGHTTVGAKPSSRCFSFQPLSWQSLVPIPTS